MSQFGRADKLLREQTRDRNPIEFNFDRNLWPKLSEDLRQRLGTTANVLDFSPASLKRADKLLKKYHQQMIEHQIKLTDDELYKLLIELSAYLGEVLLLNSDAKLVAGKTLRETSIRIEGRLKIIKGGEIRKSNSLAFCLGNLSAAAWDRLEVILSPDLYKYYRYVKSRTFREKL